MTITEAMERQNAIEKQLAEAKSETRRLALEEYAKARELCKAAGVELPALAGERAKRKTSPAKAAAMAKLWASLTPEQHAAKVRAMQAGRSDMQPVQ